MSDTVKAICYVQIAPDFNYGDRVVGANVVRLTQKRPGVPVGGTILVRMAVEIPVAAFGPLAVAVTVPESAVIVTPLEATVEEETS